MTGWLTALAQSTPAAPTSGLTVGLNAFIAVACLLFAVGLFGVLLRRNTLIMLMSLELMLTAASIALVAFARYNQTLDGALFVFFIITVAAAEVAVGLALVVALFRKRESVMVDDYAELKD